MLYCTATTMSSVTGHGGPLKRRDFRNVRRHDEIWRVGQVFTPWYYQKFRRFDLDFVDLDQKFWRVRGFVRVPKSFEESSKPNFRSRSAWGEEMVVAVQYWLRHFKEATPINGFTLDILSLSCPVQPLYRYLPARYASQPNKYALYSILKSLYKHT